MARTAHSDTAAHPTATECTVTAGRTVTAEHAGATGLSGAGREVAPEPARGPVPVLEPGMRFLTRPPSLPAPARREPPSPPPPAARRAPRTQHAAAAAEVRRRVEVTLRLVLEVLDLRRRPDHLKGFAERGVIEMVHSLARTAPPGRALGAAVLRRIHITSARAGAAEICATYVRGDRTLAIAGRFERRRGEWVCTALHLA